MKSYDLMTWMLFCFLLVISALTAYTIPVLWEMRLERQERRERRIVREAVKAAVDRYRQEEICYADMILEAYSRCRAGGVPECRLTGLLKSELERVGEE